MQQDLMQRFLSRVPRPSDITCIDISYITQNSVRFYTSIVSAMKPDVILGAEILDTPLYRKRH